MKDFRKSFAKFTYCITPFASKFECTFNDLRDAYFKNFSTYGGTETNET